MYENDTEETVAISEILYIPEDNIVQIVPVFNEIEAKPYVVKGKNILDSENQVITLEGLAYPISYKAPALDAVSIISTSYFIGQEIIYDVENISNLTVEFTVVNTGNESYEALPYSVYINNDPGRVVSRGTINIGKDSKVKVRVSLGSTILQENETLTMKISSLM